MAALTVESNELLFMVGPGFVTELTLNIQLSGDSVSLNAGLHVTTCNCVL